MDSTTKFKGIDSKGISNVTQSNFQPTASNININPDFVSEYLVCFYEIDKEKTNIRVNFSYIKKSCNSLITLMKKLFSRSFFMETIDIQDTFYNFPSKKRVQL